MVARERQKEFIQMLIDNTTQEVVKNYCEINNIKIEDYQFGSFVKDTSKVNHNAKDHFTKIFDDVLRELFEKKIISLSEFGLLTLLSTYMDYENNELKINNEYMTQKDIIKISGLGKTKVIAIINNFINHNLLFVQKHPKDSRKNIYYLNPYLFFKGLKIDRQVKKMIDDKDNKIVLG